MATGVAANHPVRQQANGTRWYLDADMKSWTSQLKYAHPDYRKKKRRMGIRATTTRKRRAPSKAKPDKTSGMNLVKDIGTPDPATTLVIQDPAHPLILFDGKAKVLSTCRDCGEAMQVIHAFEYVHPCCTPQPTKVESLAIGWLTCIEAGDTESADLTAAEIEERDNAKPDMKAAALQYISWGWPVFPLLPKGEKNRSGVVSDGKMPATPHGFKDATTDFKRISKWWDRHPDHNIGLATGFVFDCIDIDPRAGGAKSFAERLDHGWTKPIIHGVVVTANGGLHLYTKATGKGNRAGVYPGMDYRGVGGYVVAPPSTLGERGRAWSWLTVPSPEIKEQGF